MRETAEFLRIWWVQIVFFVGLIAAWVKSMKAQEKKEKQWKDEIDDAIVAILHGLIWDAGMNVLNSGRATVDEMDNLTTMYDAYEKRGGNGSVKRLMKRIDNHVKIIDCATPDIMVK